MIRRRATTLVELLLACTVLLIMTTVMFAAWNSASGSWLGSFRSTSRLSSLQLALIQMNNRLQDGGAQATIYQDAPAAPALAFCSAAGLSDQGQAGSYSYRPGGLDPLWQKYGVYYLDEALQLKYREEPIAATDPAALSQTQIDHWPGPSGLQALDFYCKHGTAVVSQVDILTIERKGSVLNVTLSSQPTAGLSGPGNTRLSVTQTIALHE